MITYRAIYKAVDGGIHAEVLDFPGVMTCAGDLNEARRMLASALRDMAEENLICGESLPRPDPYCSAPDADLEEPIHF